MGPQDLRQAEYLGNRLGKNEKRLRKWARREGVKAFRVYDNDIPEIPLAIELFRETRPLGGDGEAVDCLVLALYERPYDKEAAEEEAWLALMARTSAEALAVPLDRVFLRRRRRQKGLSQYERDRSLGFERKVEEGGLSFIVNFTDYLDTGLFLDHRPTRALVRAEAEGRRFLNLFAYTGSFSVYAAAGGASEVTSVDLSTTYLSWAARNLAINGLENPAHSFVKSDVRAFLAKAAGNGRKWDLIVCDPPTFSNSSSVESDFDVNRQWPDLIAACLGVLAPDGSLFFSSNSRRLRWSDDQVEARVEDLSDSCLPPDFRDRRIRRTWRLRGSPDPVKS